MSIELKSTATTSNQNYKKIVIHGPSGVGKTLLAATSPPFRPLVILTEKTGEESLSPPAIAACFGANNPSYLYDIPFVEAYDQKSFEEAIAFAKTSDHDLIIFDSISKASRWILKAEKAVSKNGMRAYGEHNDKAMALIEDLMLMPKHVILIAHSSASEDNGAVVWVPHMEGKSLLEKIVYEFPHILHYDIGFTDSGVEYRALRAKKGTTDKRCKNRGGQLDELEPIHLGSLICKLMQPSEPVEEA
jgi:hypothetical protein